jgi:hypothetical protein
MRKEKIDNPYKATNQMQKTQNTTHHFTIFLPSVRRCHDETQPRDEGGRFEVKLTTYHHLLTRQR